MPATMILRFRDLAGPTISEHRKIVGAHGYVWWGWWNKAQERVPRHTFAEFAAKTPFPVYLVDSAKEALYRATLMEIRPTPTEDPIASPEPARTPDYYNTQTYKAWFRFTSIEEVQGSADEEIRKWSYDEVAEFIDDPASSIFHDKRIFNMKEMLNRRHRTIYFAQPYSQGHRDHLVELLPEERPRNYTAQPIFSDSTYVVHVSDLHFSLQNHAFALKDDFVKRSLATLISDDLRLVYRGMPPAAIIISGDLTWQGKQDEFQWASEFIKHLMSTLTLGPQHFVVVPGNHDIQWAEQAEHEYDRTKRVDRASEAAEKNYREFYKAIFGLAPTASLSMGRRYVLANYVSLDVVGLNSCRLEQKPFAGYGYISEEQFRGSVREMGWESEKHRARYRVLVLHHHVIPVTASEEPKFDPNYSLTLDAAQLMYLSLGQQVSLIAHGHMHQPFVAAITRSAKGADLRPAFLTVHGAGSAGVSRTHVGAIGKNSYSVYEFLENGVDLRIRSCSETHQGFEDDWRCHLHYAPNVGLTPLPPARP